MAARQEEGIGKKSRTGYAADIFDWQCLFFLSFYLLAETLIIVCSSFRCGRCDRSRFSRRSSKQGNPQRKYEQPETLRAQKKEVM